ncbi:MAG TPA: HD-GYP domain-containing protein [Terriglobales bacterium]|nr:HD-GYP domain-containing protein [Terriglobales bacterium]
MNSLSPRPYLIVETPKVLVIDDEPQVREFLVEALRSRTEQLEFTRHLLNDSYRSALETVVATLEAREKETYAHSFRVRAYALHLARSMKYPAADLPRLAHAALLHDVGKVAVPDAILLKPGPLNAKEFELLKSHAVVGERIVNRMGFLAGAGKVIRHHHERWDGRGYPDGIGGCEIPFGSRLFAVADTLDAMTSHRCYRDALTIQDAYDEIHRCTGTQFDPEVAQAFLDVPPETWLRLQREADRDANAAIIPDVEPGKFLPCAEAPAGSLRAIAQP